MGFGLRTAVSAFIMSALIPGLCMAAGKVKEYYAFAFLDQTLEYRLVGKLPDAKGNHFVAERDAKGNLVRLSFVKGGKASATQLLQGAAAVAFEHSGKDTLRRFLDPSNKPFAAEGVPVVRVTPSANKGKTLLYLNSEGAPAEDWDGNFGYGCTWSGLTFTAVPLDAKGKPKAGTSVRVTVNKAGTEAKRSIIDADGRIVPDYENIGIRQYTYDRGGAIKEIRYLNADGARMVDAYDIHCQSYEYDKQGRLQRVRLLGKSGNLIEIRPES